MTIKTKLSELTGDYVLDTARTRIGFVAPQAMVTKVRGQFAEFEGSARLDGDDAARSTAGITIQAGSIQTRNRRRDHHLSRAFLDVPNHPAMTFTSTGVEQIGEAAFRVTGDLTMRGVTRPVTLDFELAGAERDESGDFRVGLQGTAIINRKDWGVRWNSVMEGAGAVVGNKVTLQLDIVAIRRS